MTHSFQNHHPNAFSKGIPEWSESARASVSKHRTWDSSDLACEDIKQICIETLSGARIIPLNPSPTTAWEKGISLLCWLIKDVNSQARIQTWFDLIPKS